MHFCYGDHVFCRFILIFNELHCILVSKQFPEKRDQMHVGHLYTTISNRYEWMCSAFIYVCRHFVLDIPIISPVQFKIYIKTQEPDKVAGCRRSQSLRQIHLYKQSKTVCLVKWCIVYNVSKHICICIDSAPTPVPHAV